MSITHRRGKWGGREGGCPPGDILAPLGQLLPPPQTFILGYYFYKTLTLGLKRLSISGEDLYFFFRDRWFLGEKDTPFPVKTFFLENAGFWVKKDTLFS